MTSEEQLELEILTVLVSGESYQSVDFSKLLKDFAGANYESIKFELIKKNYIEESYSDKNRHKLFFDLYKISPIGIRRQIYLARKKYYDKIAAWAFWIIFGATIISAVYSVLTYYDKPVTPISRYPLEEKIKKEEKSNPSKPILPDTTKVQDDSLKNPVGHLKKKTSINPPPTK